MEQESSPPPTLTAKSFCIALALCIAYLLAGIDFTALNLALASIQTDLSLSLVQMQWVMTGYLVPFAAVLIASGRIGDTFGHKKTFLTGVILFFFASLSAGLAQNGPMLITSRAIQGIGGALFWPSVPALALHHFGKKWFPILMGILFGALGLGMSGGPVFGGIIIDNLSWRWIFYINIPLSFFSILTIWVSNINHELPQSKKALDWIGLLLVTVTSFAIIFSIDDFANYGADSPLFYIALAIFILTLLCFILRELNVDNPVLDFRHLSSTHFNLQVTFRCLVNYSYFTVLFMTTYFLQYIYDLSPLHVGLLFLPMMIPVAFISPYIGYLIVKIGGHIMGLIGTLIILLGLIILSLLGHHEIHSLIIIIPLLLVGIGYSTLFPVSNNAIIRSLPTSYAGIATGVLYAFITLTGSIAISIGGLLIQTVGRNFIWTHINEQQISVTTDQSELIESVISGGNSMPDIQQSFGIQSEAIYTILKDGFTLAYKWSLYISIALILIGIITLSRWVFYKMEIKKNGSPN
ncbi:MAG: Multidrug resistance protein Stp [Chlamydiia bacterium]|nr:Multidrug resistance protein Stp [Chlamydiia bacterium]